MSNRRPRLKNKVALITGGSRGLGKAMALRFAGEGASVAINYVSHKESAEEVCRTIVGGGGRAIAVQADVGDPAQVDRMVATVLKEFARIDLLVNNAGILKVSPLMEIPLDEVGRMVDVNINGIIRCVQAVGNGMIARKYGRILNLSSIAALGTTFPGTSAYAATKAAVIVLTKRMALELGPHNITANAIAPGFIKTDMTVQNEDSPETRRKLEGLAQRAMLGRVGEPEDIAHAALFLVSDEASFLTGQLLTVDGGRMDCLSHSA